MRPLEGRPELQVTGVQLMDKQHHWHMSCQQHKPGADASRYERRRRKEPGHRDEAYTTVSLSERPRTAEESNPQEFIP